MIADVNLVNVYRDNLEQIFRRITETQVTALIQAATWAAEVIEANNIIYTLGSGHSLLIATELYYRAGGLANFDVIHDRTFGRTERLAGYGKLLLDSYPISAKDLLILVSNSGRNELTVEMAIEARQRGIRTVAITSLAHSLAVSPRTVSGFRLCDVADLVIDNCGRVGDASVEATSPRESVMVAPTSTVAGIFIANSIVSLTTQILLNRGIDPPVFASANIDNGDKKNEDLLRFLRERLRGL
ncbi:MAG: sugar isomerase domain-containing protein [Bryobacteraceae bacterium]